VKRSAAAGALLLLAGAYLLATAVVAVAAPCDRAEQLAAIDLTAARAEYVKLLGEQNPPECATAGFSTVAVRRRQVDDLLARAEDEVALKRRAEAVKLVASARVIDPSSDRAQTVLAALAAPPDTPKPAPSAFAGAQALLDAGYRDQARELAGKVATDKGLPIPPQFSAPDESVPARVKTWTADLTTVVAAVAIAGVAITTVGAFIYKATCWVVRRRFVSLGTISVVPAGGADAKASSVTADALKAVIAEEMTEAARNSTTFTVVDASAVGLPDSGGACSR